MRQRGTQSFLSSRSYQQAVTRQLSEQMLDRSVPLQEQLTETTLAVAKTLHIDSCVIGRLIRRDTIRIVAATGWNDTLGDHYPIANTLIGYTIEMAEEAIVCKDLWDDERFGMSELERKRHACSALCCCIPGSEGKLWGAVAVYTYGPRAFDMEDGHFLETLANLVSGTIQRQDLLRSYTDSLERIDTLRSQIAKAVEQGMVHSTQS